MCLTTSYNNTRDKPLRTEILGVAGEEWYFSASSVVAEL